MMGEEGLKLLFNIDNYKERFCKGLAKKIIENEKKDMYTP